MLSVTGRFVLFLDVFLLQMYIGYLAESPECRSLPLQLPFTTSRQELLMALIACVFWQNTHWGFRSLPHAASASQKTSPMDPGKISHSGNISCSTYILFALLM